MAEPLGVMRYSCVAAPQVVQRCRTPRGAVFIPFCYYEAAANLLTNPVLDPFGKIPEFKYCAVRVTAGGAEGATRGYASMRDAAT